MVDLSIQSFLPQAVQYLQDAQPTSIPNWRVDRPFEGTPLAQGEYNLNFLVGQGNFHWVLRVNSRSEIGLSNPGQITYEYQTLALLAPSGSSPSPTSSMPAFRTCPMASWACNISPASGWITGATWPPRRA